MIRLHTHNSTTQQKHKTYATKIGSIERDRLSSTTEDWKIHSYDSFNIRRYECCSSFDSHIYIYKWMVPSLMLMRSNYVHNIHVSTCGVTLGGYKAIFGSDSTLIWRIKMNMAYCPCQQSLTLLVTITLNHRQQ